MTSLEIFLKMCLIASDLYGLGFYEEVLKVVHDLLDYLTMMVKLRSIRVLKSDNFILVTYLHERIVEEFCVLLTFLQLAYSIFLFPL